MVNEDAGSGITLAEIAEKYGAKLKAVQIWASREGWPDPLPRGRGGPAHRYDPHLVDRFVHASADGITLAEVAERYGKTLRTVKNWAGREEWPDPMPPKPAPRGRGRPVDRYDPQLVERFVVEQTRVRQPPSLPAGTRLTRKQVAARLGVGDATLRAYLAREQFPHPNVDDDGTEWWPVETVDATIAGRTRQRQTGL